MAVKLQQLRHHALLVSVVGPEGRPRTEQVRLGLAKQSVDEHKLLRDRFIASVKGA